MYYVALRVSYTACVASNYSHYHPFVWDIESGISPMKQFDSDIHDSNITSGKSHIYRLSLTVGAFIDLFFNGRDAGLLSKDSRYA